MKVGVTATRDGLTDLQKDGCRLWLIRLEATDLIHGDCIGGDTDCHLIAKSLELGTIIRPPLNPKLRAFCNADVTHEPKDYAERNHDIVDECDQLLVLPKSMEEEQRSGTWATKRYAHRMKKPYIIIYPNGDEFRTINKLAWNK